MKYEATEMMPHDHEIWGIWNVTKHNIIEQVLKLGFNGFNSFFLQHYMYFPLDQFFKFKTIAFDGNFFSHYDIRIKCIGNCSRYCQLIASRRPFYWGIYTIASSLPTFLTSHHCLPLCLPHFPPLPSPIPSPSPTSTCSHSFPTASSKHTHTHTHRPSCSGL